MAKSCSTYQGALMEIKKTNFNLDLVANTNDRDTNSKISRFSIGKATTINKGASAVGACGEVPVNCDSHDVKEVIADYQLSANHIYDDCACDIDESTITHSLNATASEWAKIQGTYFFSKINPKLQDKTADIVGNVNYINIKEEILAGVKYLVKTSKIAMSELVVVVGSDAYFELMALEIACCDYQMATEETNKVLGLKLGVKRIVMVPDDILSGNINGTVLDEENTIRFSIYPQTWAPFKEFCTIELDMRETMSKDYIGSIPQLGGRGLIGADFFGEITDGLKVYNAAPVIV